MSEARRIRDRRAVDNAVETGPQRAGHAHRTRLARGVEGIAPERIRVQAFARQSDRVHFSMRAGIVLRSHSVRGAHQADAALAVYNLRPKGYRVRRVHG